MSRHEKIWPCCGTTTTWNDKSPPPLLADHVLISCPNNPKSQTSEVRRLVEVRSKPQPIFARLFRWR